MRGAIAAEDLGVFAPYVEAVFAAMILTEDEASTKG